MSATPHLTPGLTVGTTAPRTHRAAGAAAGPADVGTTDNPRARVVLMRRRPIGRSRHTRLHGLFSTGSTLTVFWTVLPLPPTSFGVDVRTYRLDHADVRACLDADVWGHEILGYVSVLAGDTATVLPSQHRSAAEHLARPEGLHDLLTDLCVPGSGIPELAASDRAPVVPSGRVLLTRWVAFPELSEMIGWDPALRARDSERVIYSASAARIQKMVLAGVPLGIRASNLAEDLDDSTDVLLAASRLYSPTSGSPYRWFQIAMDDARRLGTKPGPPFDPRRA